MPGARRSRSASTSATVVPASESGPLPSTGKCVFRCEVHSTTGTGQACPRPVPASTPRPKGRAHTRKFFRLASVGRPYESETRMPTSPKHLLRHSLTLLALASIAVGCHVTVHNYGKTTPKGGGGSETTSGHKAPPNSDRPEDKPDKPKQHEPKPDKPKDEHTDKPHADKPHADKPSEPPPPPGVSRLTVPVRAPFEQIVEQVDALLPKTQSHDWQRMGKEGDSTVLDVKYTVWRDPIEAKFKGRTLTVVVPVRYAAKLRGKVKNPFGSDYFPLNDGQTWGTKSSPQRLRLTIQLELGVTDEWELVSEAKLGEIEHGPPPNGNFCAHAGIDLCTPKASFADEVHKNIERYLSPRVMKELDRAERELEKNLDLRAKASALWAAVQKPLSLQRAGDKSCATVLLAACKKDAWLVFEPSSFGLSELSLVEGDFGIDVGLEGKLTVATAKKPKVGTAKLPKAAKLPGSTAFQVSVTLDIPTAVLAQSIKSELSSLGLRKDDKAVEVSKVRVLASKGELRIEIETKGAYAGTIKLGAKPVFDEKKGEIRVEKVTFDDQELEGIDTKVIARAVEKAVYVPVGKEAKVLRRAITRALDGALPGQLEVKGSLDELDVQSVEALGGDLMHLNVELRGSLSLEYSP